MPTCCNTHASGFLLPKSHWYKKVGNSVIPMFFYTMQAKDNVFNNTGIFPDNVRVQVRRTSVLVTCTEEVSSRSNPDGIAPSNSSACCCACCCACCGTWCTCVLLCVRIVVHGVRACFGACFCACLCAWFCACFCAYCCACCCAWCT